MLVKETLLIVQQTPLAHDAAATAHDTTETTIGQMDVVATDAGMDGEIVNTLLALFDERVAIHFPGEVFYLAVHFFQSLVDGDCAHGNRTVAQNPFACLVDIITGREVHQRVATPFARPDSLVHLLIDRGCGGRVADIGVDLHREVSTDNHRLALGMMDVGGDDGTAAGQLVAHKLGGDMTLDAQCLAVHVLADSHILHLGGDDASLGTCHLGDTLPLCRTVVNPLLAQVGQTFLEVNRIVGVGIGTTGVVDKHRFVFLCMGLAIVILCYRGCEVDLLHTHLYIRVNCSLHIVFLTLCVSLVIVDH